MNDNNILEKNYKKNYIVNNIDLINHKKIIDYIFFKKIIYSENNFGYLINISKLSYDHIVNIYNIIYNTIENNNDNDNKEKEEYKIILENNNNTNNYLIKEISNHIIIDLKDFNNSQRELIKKSKNYKFE